MEQRKRTQGGNHDLRRTCAARQSVALGSETGPREWVVALVVIGAAALATFLALFLTSRPYDPMNSTVQPQQSVPQGQLQLQATTDAVAINRGLQREASVHRNPRTNTRTSADDATVQQEIEQALHSDSALADLDISTIVEGGRVTIVGSVRSVELKQRVVRVVRGIKGVSSIDNQLVVIEATP
jgi:hypothetical protein